MSRLRQAVTRSLLALVLAVAGLTLQASLEVYAPLAEATFDPGGALVNLAQSLTSAKIGAGSVQHIDK